ncbi:DUF6221 family protein [Streptomyces murinus]|uniref:DUF6221 family protein n=1 Tax=Streptomyces murinus TaxID=33900 RepID=UPI0038269BC4
MDDLVEFLRARLDEDERIARAATPGPWWHNPGKQWLSPDAFEKYDLHQGEEFVGYGGPHPFTGAVASTGPASHMQAMKDAAFIAAHDPARVLREIDAKRRIIALWKAADDDAAGEQRHADSYDTGADGWPMGREDALSDVLRLLALSYADRPGYKESWRP